MNAKKRFAVRRRYLWHDKSWMRVAMDWLLVLVVAYLSLILGLYVFQRNLLYFPDATEFAPEEWGLASFQRVRVQSADGLFISHWYSKSQTEGAPAIIFFQGNAGHVAYRNFKVKPWVEAGYSVLLVGYRGYADNPGQPTELGIYDDARSALRYLQLNNVPMDHWVFYGESLGSGVAVQMATEFPAAGIILEAPYTSVPDVGAARYPILPIKLITKDVYNSIEKIGRIRSPLLLIHGDADVVIPIRFGRRLFDAAPEPKQAAFIPGGGHNDLYDLRTQQLILNFIAGLGIGEK